MKPPIFSGSIRDYARFKAGVHTIVMSYFDPVYQVYVLKETCLQGQAGSLVCNLENIADIWERVAVKYGNTIDTVDSVIKDLQNCSNTW